MMTHGAAMRTVLFALSMLLVLAPGGVLADYPSLSSAPSVEATGQGDAVLIVGIGTYAFLPDIDGVVETVNDWETFFVRGLGIPAAQVFTLVDTRATRERMQTFAERASEAVEEGGTLWFVYVGHGAPNRDGTDGVLVGVDAQSEPASLEGRGLSRGALLEILEKGPQAQTTVILDACFSGQVQGGQALAEGMQPVVPYQQARAYQPRGSTVVMAAAGADQFAGALPGARRPAFSYVLLGALRGWAVDGGGEVTAADAIHYTRQQLRHLDHDQTPDLEGANDLVLVRGARESDPGLIEAMRRATGQSQPVRPTPVQSTPVRADQPQERSTRERSIAVCDFKTYFAETARGRELTREIDEEFQRRQAELDRRQERVGATGEGLEDLQEYYTESQRLLREMETEALRELRRQFASNATAPATERGLTYIVAEESVIFAQQTSQCSSLLSDEASVHTLSSTVATVDYTPFFENSTEGQRFKAALASQFEAFQSRLDSQQQEVLELQARLSDGGLDEDARRQLAQELERQINALQRSYTQLQDELKERERAATELIEKNVQAIAAEFARQQEIAVVLMEDFHDETILWRALDAPYHLATTDITDDLLRLYNQRHP